MTPEQIEKVFAEAEKIEPKWERCTVFNWATLIGLRDLALKGLQVEALKQKWEKAREEGEVMELSREAQEALNDLAAGFKIKSEGSGWWPALIYEQTKKISGPIFDELSRAGFLQGIANGSGFLISDKGRKAHLKSTDELGDGKVHVLNERKET